MQEIKCQVCGRSIHNRDNVKICSICRLKTYRKVKKQTKKWGRHLARSGAPVSAFSMVFTLTVVTFCVTVATVAGYTYLSPNRSHVAPGSHGNNVGPGTGSKGTLAQPAGKITEFPFLTLNSNIIGDNLDGITSGPDGNLWFTEDTNVSDGTGVPAISIDKLVRITPHGTFTEFPLTATNSTIVAARSDPTTVTDGLPEAITSGPDGNLWFTEAITATPYGGDGTIILSSSGKIGRITPKGVITEFSLPTANTYPTGITSGSDGNLWFTEISSASGGSAVGRITPKGVITEFPLSTTNAGLVAITNGPDGNLWFTEEGSGKIGRITPLGTISEFLLPTVGTSPVMLTSGPDGNLWFTEVTGFDSPIGPTASSTIGRITPKGVITEFSIPGSSSQGGYRVFRGILNGPTAITGGSDGNLWFTNPPDRIGRITPEGKVTEFPIPPESNGTYGYLYAITNGSDNNLWFTKITNINSTVERITSGL
jgi:streptogramin lyase